jgi:hypothetical protein
MGVPNASLTYPWDLEQSASTKCTAVRIEIAFATESQTYLDPIFKGALLKHLESTGYVRSHNARTETFAGSNSCDPSLGSSGNQKL